MLEGIQGFEEIPFVSTTAQPVQTRRRALPIHSSFASSGQRGPSKKGGRNTATRLFCKQGVPRCRREVPPDGKISLHTSNGSTDQPLKRAMSSPEAVGRMAL